MTLGLTLTLVLATPVSEGCSRFVSLEEKLCVVKNIKTEPFLSLVALLCTYYIVSFIKFSRPQKLVQTSMVLKLSFYIIKNRGEHAILDTYRSEKIFFNALILQS